MQNAKLQFKIKNYLSSKIFISKLLAVVFGICLLLFYGYFSFATGAVFNSPDEQANYFFTRLWAEKGNLTYPAPLNFLAFNQIYPRSTTVANGNIVPGSFLGLIFIFGFLAKIFGSGKIIYFTSIFTVTAIFCFYKIILKIFGKKVAVVSAIFLSFFPIFWYYSSRGLYHNVLFLSLFIFSVYFLIFGRRTISAGFSGLLLGLALMVRSSEFWWIAAVLIFLGIIYRREIGWHKILIIVAAACLVLLPMLCQNQALYGSPFKTGYEVFSNKTHVAEAVPSSSNLSNLSDGSNLLLFFGFRPRTIWSNFQNYFLGLLWPWAILLGMGILIFVYELLKRRVERRKFAYFSAAIFIFAWQLIYYGSGVYRDNPNLYPAIGNSFLRYLLPSFVFLLPLAVEPILRLLNFFRNKIFKYGVLVFILAFFAFFSFYQVFYSLDDGLVYIKENIYKYKEIKKQILNLTEDDAIIITKTADKFFFPERQVITNIGPEVVVSLPRLISVVPVYYYGIGMSRKEENDSEKKLGADLERVKIFGKEALYRLSL